MSPSTNIRASATPSTTTPRRCATTARRPRRRGRRPSPSSAATCAERRKGPASPPGPSVWSLCSTLVPVAHEAQQEQEHVDEVEIERQRAHDLRLAVKIGAGDREVHALDLLGVPG